MKFVLVLLLLFGTFSTEVRSETNVLSGFHGGFTRIVFYSRDANDFSIIKSKKNEFKLKWSGLESERPNFSNVYNRIPRVFLDEIYFEFGFLGIITKCSCELLSSYDVQLNALVIDLLPDSNLLNYELPRKLNLSSIEKTKLGRTFLDKEKSPRASNESIIVSSLQSNSKSGSSLISALRNPHFTPKANELLLNGSLFKPKENELSISVSSHFRERGFYNPQSGALINETFSCSKFEVLNGLLDDSEVDLTDNNKFGIDKVVFYISNAFFEEAGSLLNQIEQNSSLGEILSWVIEVGKNLSFKRIYSLDQLEACSEPALLFEILGRNVEDQTSFPELKREHAIVAVNQFLKLNDKLMEHFEGRLRAFLEKFQFGDLTPNIKMEDTKKYKPPLLAENWQDLQAEERINRWGTHSEEGFRNLLVSLIEMKMCAEAAIAFHSAKNSVARENYEFEEVYKYIIESILKLNESANKVFCLEVFDAETEDTVVSMEQPEFNETSIDEQKINLKNLENISKKTEVTKFHSHTEREILEAASTALSASKKSLQAFQRHLLDILDDE